MCSLALLINMNLALKLKGIDSQIYIKKKKKKKELSGNCNFIPTIRGGWLGAAALSVIMIPLPGLVDSS